MQDGLSRKKEIKNTIRKKRKKIFQNKVCDLGSESVFHKKFVKISNGHIYYHYTKAIEIFL